MNNSMIAGLMTGGVLSYILPLFSITNTSILYWIIIVICAAFAGWIVK